MEIKSGMTPGALAGNCWPSASHQTALPGASPRRSGVLEQGQAETAGTGKADLLSHLSLPNSPERSENIYKLCFA